MQLSAKPKGKVPPTTNLRRKEQGSLYINGAVAAVAFAAGMLVAVATLSDSSQARFNQQLHNLGFVADKAELAGESSSITYRDGTKASLDQIITQTVETRNGTVRAYKLSTNYMLEVIMPNPRIFFMNQTNPDFRIIKANIDGTSTNLPSFLRAGEGAFHF